MWAWIKDDAFILPVHPSIWIRGTTGSYWWQSTVSDDRNRYSTEWESENAFQSIYVMNLIINESCDMISMGELSPATKITVPSLIGQWNCHFSVLHHFLIVRPNEKSIKNSIGTSLSIKLCSRCQFLTAVCCGCCCRVSWLTLYVLFYHRVPAWIPTAQVPPLFPSVYTSFGQLLLQRVLVEFFSIVSLLCCLNDPISNIPNSLLSPLPCRSAPCVCEMCISGKANVVPPARSRIGWRDCCP